MDPQYDVQGKVSEFVGENIGAVKWVNQAALVTGSYDNDNVSTSHEFWPYAAYICYNDVCMCVLCFHCTLVNKCSLVSFAPVISIKSSSFDTHPTAYATKSASQASPH